MRGTKMKKCNCINCGKPATCEHHIVPLVLGGFDIPSNRAPLCDDCHGLIHSLSFNKGGISHSELIKRGIQRKKEAIAKGEQYKGRRTSKGSNYIGRPTLKKEDIPQTFITIYTSQNYGTISNLAKQVNMSRTTVYRYIAMLEE